MEQLDSYDSSRERAWLGALLAIVVTLTAASLVFPRAVYDKFIWRYFIGPVRADANTVECYVYFTDTAEILSGAQAQGCAPTTYENGFVVTAGYTPVSTLGYVLILVFMLAGVYMLLNRFDLQPYREFFFALVPFMLFGGALRTVEDSFVAAQDAGVTPLLEYPLSSVLISPFIYFTVFGIALGAFLLSKWLAGEGLTDTYTYPLGAIGTGVLATTFGYLLYVSLTTEYATFYPTLLATVVGIASVSAVVTYFGVDKLVPEVNEGTGLVGLVVIWGHAIDGVANVIANDWIQVWNPAVEYTAKHPFNAALMNVTNTIQGGQEILGVYVGEAWPFVLVKLAAPVLILSLFDDEFIEDSPRFSYMLLGAVIAVGLGPGTRDMIRIAFGI